MPYRKAAIRPVRSEDEPRLFGLARMVFGERGGWDDRRTLAVLGTEQVFVAEVDQSVAGFVALDDADDAVRIDELLVSPDHEAEGVGGQLLDWAEGYAISIGAERLQVVVEDDNRRAEAFYRGRGFVPRAEGLLELLLPKP